MPVRPVSTLAHADHCTAWCGSGLGAARVTVPVVTIMRRCSRTACGRPAVATLTYVYADQTAVLGRLATYAEPHTYDLCAEHAIGLTAPRGWQVVRLVATFDDVEQYPDDLLAVANAVEARPRRTSRTRPAEPNAAPGTNPPSPPGARGRPGEGTQPPASGAAPGTGRRRGHLRVLPEA